jgi:hypothetical protein
MDLTPCRWLDDYLAHDLTGDEHARFVTHLPDCADCRRAVRERERLATLLTEATTKLDPVPTDLTDRISRRLRATRRRRFAAAAAALAVIASAVWLIGRTAPRPDKPQPPLADVKPAPESPPPAERVRVTFPESAHVLAVPAPTESPNVTFLWVYPAVRVAPPAERSDE